MRAGTGNVLICRDEAAVSREASERFICTALKSIAEWGMFYVAVPGGSSPRGMFQIITSYAKLIPWQKVHFFFTDERCVPPESDESNYKLAYDLLLSKVPIPASNIHRFLGESPRDEAAEVYEHEIIAVMGENPRFDLVVLGMGADTHTASLFPNSPALDEQSRIAVENYIEQLGTYRLTLTIPILCNANSVIILAMGMEKADALKEVLQGEYNPHLHPIQTIQPASGRLLWIVDNEAASKL